MSEIEEDTIHTSDLFDKLPELPENCVHTVVTDPPYAFDGGFMGKDWDNFSDARAFQEWCMKWGQEVKRVLKPGGHLLAFGGNTNHHRLFTGIEDAGFEIRDTLTYHYGSGFPKALDVSKAIDKRGGRVIKGVGPVIEKARKEKNLSTQDVAEHFTDKGQEPTGCVWNWENGESNPTPENFNKLIKVLDLPFEPIEPGEREIVGKRDWSNSANHFVPGEDHTERVNLDITAPATDAAERWDGFKTALKPATEFVVLARKPLSEGTVAENVQTHGTGALNVGECRVGDAETHTNITDMSEHHGNNWGAGNQEESLGYKKNPPGRYPSNVVFHEGEAERLDQQQNVSVHGANNDGKTNIGEYENTSYKAGIGERNPDYYGDNPKGPSRYFYTSKATKAERTLDGRIDNAHPTVKPQDLMEWLVKLVTAENQIVLDPFCGSGTTCKAAKELNRRFIGIEKQAKWADVARVRVGLTPNDPSAVRGDGDQEGLESYTDA